MGSHPPSGPCNAHFGAGPRGAGSPVLFSLQAGLGHWLPAGVRSKAGCPGPRRKSIPSTCSAQLQMAAWAGPHFCSQAMSLLYVDPPPRHGTCLRKLQGRLLLRSGCRAANDRGQRRRLCCQDAGGLSSWRRERGCQGRGTKAPANDTASSALGPHLAGKLHHQAPSFVCPRLCCSEYEQSCSPPNVSVVSLPLHAGRVRHGQGLPQHSCRQWPWLLAAGFPSPQASVSSHRQLEMAGQCRLPHLCCPGPL